MPETTITDRKFAQDMRAAKKAASNGPVVITDRGRPSHVLLSYEEYERLRRDEPTIVDLLGMPEAEDIEFDPPKLNLSLKPVDFD